MNPDVIYERYQRLQRYIGWDEEDAARIAGIADLLRPCFGELIDDFYATIKQEPDALEVITGGEEQIARLKVTLHGWLEELFSGRYDQAYVVRRWKVGRRHVDIGLDQVYTNVALSRLRRGLHDALRKAWTGDENEFSNTARSLHQLLDLDLAIIEDAYQAEYLARQQQIDRLATIGQVAGGVAHELRNPLNVMKTSIYYLRNARKATPEKTAEHMERIDRQIGLADDVIRALSDFAKLPMPEVHPVEVESLLGDVLENIHIPASVATSVACPPELPRILVDEGQFKIVLANLVRNALDAMASGGQLDLAACVDDEHVQIEVQDTGTGIDPDHIARILQPLFSTKARGIGLGLAITKAILDKHQGWLEVESEVGQGTTFRIHIPAEIKQEQTNQS